MVGDNPVLGDNEPRPLTERLGVFITNDYEYDRPMCALVDVLSSNLWPSLCTAHRRNQAAKNGCENRSDRRLVVNHHNCETTKLEITRNAGECIGRIVHPSSQKSPAAFRRRARGRSRATNGDRRAHGVTCAMGQSPHLGRIWLLIRLK